MGQVLHPNAVTTDATEKRSKKHQRRFQHTPLIKVLWYALLNGFKMASAVVSRFLVCERTFCS